MTCRDLESIALALVAEGKGILAADETTPTLTKRFDSLGIPSTEQSRRIYRRNNLASAKSRRVDRAPIQAYSLARPSWNASPSRQ
jgi:fructose-bisphosphate aldolase class 1